MNLSPLSQRENLTWVFVTGSCLVLLPQHHGHVLRLATSHLTHSAVTTGHSDDDAVLTWRCSSIFLWDGCDCNIMSFGGLLLLYTLPLSTKVIFAVVGTSEVVT